MDEIAVKPKQAQLRGCVIGLAALAVGMLAFPALCLPLAMVVPLLACPLVGHSKQEPVAWISAAIPAAAALLGGWDALYAASLLAPGMLAMGLTRYLRRGKRMDPADMLWYICCAAVSLVVTIACLTQALGAPVPQVLTEKLVSAVESSEQSGRLLYRLAAAGLLRVPEGYMDGGLLGQMMVPVHEKQMLMSLRLTLERLMESLLPSLCVQASLICGLFTTLRVQRFNGVLVIVEINRDRPSERKAHVSEPPGFRLFTLPRHVRWALIAVAVLSVMMLTDANPLSGTLSTMGFALWRTLLQLEGAAVLVFLFTAHDPDRAAAAGLLSAALFVLAPTVLLVLGIGDPVFHFRRVPHTDDE